MLRLGPPKKRGKKKPPRKAPRKARAGGHGLRAGQEINCGWCGEDHILAPCSNKTPEYDAWLFYHCSGRLRLAALAALDGTEMAFV